MAKKMSFADRVKERAKQAEFSGGTDALKIKDGLSFYKPKKGKNEFIVVPFEMDLKKNAEGVQPGELWFRLQILKHFRIGPDDKSVICPKTIGKKCPICEHRAALISQGKATDDPEVKELSARKRELYYVIDLNDDDKLKIFECSYHNFGRKLEEEIREADDDSLVANFASPDGGAILTVRMAEESVGKTKYLEATRFDFEDRGKAEDKLVAAAMDEVTPFGELLIVKSYEDLRNLLYDLGPEDADDSESPDEEEPASRRRPAAGRKASSKNDSDDDDESETDDEEKPAPRKRRVPAEDEAPKTRRKAPADDDEDDNDDRPVHRKSTSKDEEEEEIPPKRKRVAKDESEEDDDEPVRRKKPAKVADDDDEPAPKKKKAKSDEPECSGAGIFGQDCDKLDECEDCPNWADCRDLTDEFEASAKRKKK